MVRRRLGLIQTSPRVLQKRTESTVDKEQTYKGPFIPLTPSGLIRRSFILLTTRLLLILRPLETQKGNERIFVLSLNVSVFQKIGGTEKRMDFYSTCKK